MLVAFLMIRLTADPLPGHRLVYDPVLENRAVYMIIFLLSL